MPTAMPAQRDDHPEIQRDAVALLRAGGAAYYRHADFPAVRRLGAAALALVTLLALALLPAQPPTVHAPAALGLGVAAALVLAGAATAAALAADRWAVEAHGTLAIALAAVAALATLDALAGPNAPYDKLFVLAIVWGSATHEPRRVLTLVAFATAARLPSLAETGWPIAEVAEAATQAIVWLGLAAFAVMWTARVRAQRDRTEREGQRAHVLARIDPLTGLGNRRAFDETTATEIARAIRSGGPLSLVVADLDDFKAINDEHGHLAGDRCLRTVAATLRATVRGPDACFRWGGDEFALLLADTTLAQAAAVAERACRAVSSGGRLSLGYGVAQFDGAEAPEALLARADRALLAAKAGAAT
jgi:diguanylate cyclase (GGDEF)-like protein